MRKYECEKKTAIASGSLSMFAGLRKLNENYFCLWTKILLKLNLGSWILWVVSQNSTSTRSISFCQSLGLPASWPSIPAEVVVPMVLQPAMGRVGNPVVSGVASSSSMKGSQPEPSTTTLLKTSDWKKYTSIRPQIAWNGIVFLRNLIEFAKFGCGCVKPIAPKNPRHSTPPTTSLATLPSSNTLIICWRPG